MLPTEPQSLFNLLEQGLRLFRATFLAVLPVAATSGCLYAAVITGFSAAMSDLQGLQPGPELTAATEAFLPWLIPATVVNVFSIVSVSYALLSAARNRVVNTREVLVRGSLLSVPLTLVAVGYAALVTLGAFALIVPGVLIFVSAGLFPYVCVLEGRSPWSALYRSHELVWPHQWLRTAAAMALIAGVAMLASTLLSLLLFPILQMADPEAPWTQQSLLSSFLFNWASVTLLQPLSVAVFLVLLVDLKVRRQGPGKPDSDSDSNSDVDSGAGEGSSTLDA